MAAGLIDRGAERRHAERRQVARGGRRAGDRRRPWWQHGIALAALAVAFRYWRRFKK